jgi:hypothetical protein
LFGGHDHRVRRGLCCRCTYRKSRVGLRRCDRLWNFERAQSDERQDLQDFAEKTFGIGAFGFAEADLLWFGAVVEDAALGLNPTAYQCRLQPPHMCLFEAIVRSGEDDAAIPEILVLKVRIAFADVDRWQLVLGASIARQNVDAGARKFCALFRCEPLFAREHDAEAGPIHAVNDANAFRITIRNKYANCKRIVCHARPCRSADTEHRSVRDPCRLASVVNAVHGSGTMQIRDVRLLSYTT